MLVCLVEGLNLTLLDYLESKSSLLGVLYFAYKSVTKLLAAASEGGPLFDPDFNIVLTFDLKSFITFYYIVFLDDNELIEFKFHG